MALAGQTEAYAQRERQLARGSCAKPAREFDDLGAWRVLVVMGLQIVLPIDEGCLQVWIGVLTAQYPQPRIADTPWPFTPQVALDEMCCVFGCRLVPIEVEIE